MCVWCSLAVLDALQEELRSWYEHYVHSSRVAMRDTVTAYMESDAPTGHMSTDTDSN